MLLPLIASVAINGQALRMDVLFTEMANLTYQLDLVAGVTQGGDPRDFQELWKQKFLKTNADQAYLKTWADLRGHYQVSAALPSLPMQFIPRQSSISIGERIRIAGLQAKSWQEYEAGLGLLVLPTDTGRFLEVVRYFQPTFHQWWQGEAEAKGRGFAEAMQKQMDDPKLAQQLDRFRIFYGSKLPDGYEAPFSLIYRPMLVQTSTSGEQLGGMSIVQFLAGEKPEQRLEVVLHEFCHFLYNTRAPEDDQTLQLRFAATRDIAARPCYNLMNEGLATALGNGVIGRLFSTPDAWSKYLAKPNSFYNNANIDRAGKRLLRLVDEWLPKGKTMNDADFVPTYIAALKQDFGDTITAPQLYLNETFMFVNNRLGRSFANKIRQDLRVSSSWTSIGDRPDKQTLESFRELPNLSAIFVIEPSQLDTLVPNEIASESDVKTIRNALKSDKSALYSLPRGPMAYTFLIVAGDQSEAERRLAQVAEAKKLFVGLMK